MTHPLAKILTALVFGSERRKAMRHKISQAIYTWPVKRKARKTGIGVRATGPCTVTRNTEIGDYTSIGGISINGGGATRIGSHVSLAPGIVILTQNHAYEGDALPYSREEFTHKPVTIEDCVWVGMNVTILPGTVIREGAVIQAGSVVHGEIPSCAIAGGNPAKVFAWRDKAHYAKLKAERRFFLGPR